MRPPRQPQPSSSAGSVETLRGVLGSFRQISADGWGVGSLEVQGQRSPVPLSGKLIAVSVGDSVEIVGAFVDHPKYGRQLKVRSCTPVRPEGNDGAVKWIASRFPGVGDKRARELVTRFGNELWTVLEREPERLAEVKGITPAVALEIAATYRAVLGEREHMVQLRGWGLTDGQVAKCVQVWESLPRVVAELRANPYLLAQEVDGFGFLRADTVARAMGVRRDAPERIRAGVEHQLSEAIASGHVFVGGAALQRITAEMLGVEPALVGPAIRQAAEEQRLVRRGWRIYSARMDRAEARCAEGVRRLLGKARAA